VRKNRLHQRTLDPICWQVISLSYPKNNDVVPVLHERDLGELAKFYKRTIVSEQEAFLAAG
jgi:hypothetical protein